MILLPTPEFICSLGKCIVSATALGFAGTNLFASSFIQSVMICSLDVILLTVPSFCCL